MVMAFLSVEDKAYGGRRADANWPDG